MPKATSRPSLPASATDFALSPSSSVGASTSAQTLDGGDRLLPRFRRPSLLAPKAGYLADGGLHSPLATSSTLSPPPSRRSSQSAATISEESESDRERMITDRSPSLSVSSEGITPPLRAPDINDEDPSQKNKSPKVPSTPPRRIGTEAQDPQRHAQLLHRRLSFPLRQPRILNLLSESKTEENELKSEAAFQRFLASCSDLPNQPRTPRDRGRYPEDASQGDDPLQDESPSEDDDEDDIKYLNSFGVSEPMTIRNPRTPADSVNGDDMSISGSPSFNAIAMDVDIPSGSPLFSTPLASWRYTPPPTSATRSNKRKYDDRFDPYPTASKRRAVSPSHAHLRDNHTNSPIGRANLRLPISIPIAIPGSTVSSATSSPTISASFPTSFTRPGSMTSSPTLRASMGLASPILRPIPRSAVGSRRGDGDEREVEGAGDAVNGLSLC